MLLPKNNNKKDECVFCIFVLYYDFEKELCSEKLDDFNFFKNYQAKLVPYLIQAFDIFKTTIECFLCGKYLFVNLREYINYCGNLKKITSTGKKFDM